MDIGQVVGRLARRTVAFNRSKLDLGTGVRCGIGVAIPGLDATRGLLRRLRGASRRLPRRLTELSTT
jgi:hypothetical protein